MTATRQSKIIQGAGLFLGGIGLVLLVLQLFTSFLQTPLWFWSCIFGLLIGGGLYSLGFYHGTQEGIKNDGVWFNRLTNGGLWGWLLGIVLTVFYVVLYFYPELLGYNAQGQSTGMIAFFDTLSYLLNGKAATQWFVYGTLYTLAILIFGFKFIFKYRNNNYQLFRTATNIFFQLGFAFLIPELLAKLNGDAPYFAKDLKNMWPLNYYFFEDWHLDGMLQGGTLGKFMLGSGLALIFIISPLLTYRYGKRWYCSWVCGCGALAETAGDPFRQLSSSKISVWKFERWMIHVVLVFISVTTLAVLWTYTANPDNGLGITQQQLWFFSLGLLGIVLLFLRGYYGKQLPKDARFAANSTLVLLLIVVAFRGWNGSEPLFGISSYQLRAWYGFGVGAMFSGVFGVGFYPLLGSRVWCRFGCPMAAILGLQQRLFSRFRITTNGGQCISCGNCTTYCEMGIDVRSYAQRGANIVRSSCVGCGICSSVCPRGVLRLENGPVHGRTATQQLEELLKNTTA